MQFTTTQTILWLIASAVGTTVIVSKGDIFKFFRDWLERLSIKVKYWIHDIEFSSDIVIKKIVIDGVEECNPNSLTAIYGMLEDEPCFINQQKTNKSNVRYFIHCKKRHDIQIELEGGFLPLQCKPYEKIEKYKFMDFISSIFQCPLCLGVYVGFFYYLVFPLRFTGIRIFDLLCEGCVVSMASYFYYKCYSFLEKK